MWDEGRMKEMDLVLHEASKAGVKLIIPIVNQDTGDESVVVGSRFVVVRSYAHAFRTHSSNWVGSTVDLIKYRYGLGNNHEARQIDWWTDHTMIER